MDPKVITDVQPFLMSVLQGYRDHVHLCQTLLQEGNSRIMDDGLDTGASYEAHRVYFNQLETLMRSAGMVTDMPQVVEEVVEVVSDVVGTEVPPQSF